MNEWEAKRAERRRALREVLAILERARSEGAEWYVWVVGHRRRRLAAERRRRP